MLSRITGTEGDNNDIDREQGEKPIVIKINDTAKIVSVWLSAEDPEWKDFPEDIRELCSRYREKKYMIATFRSGSDDLCDNTLALLKHNRRLSAEKEVRETKAASGQ